jgi:hypothetical protein
MRFFRQFVCLLFALYAAFPLIAQETGGVAALDWFARGSVLFFPEDNGNASAPMPILPSFGGGVSYSINDLFAVEASLDLYGTSYDYSYSLGRAVPATDEFRSAYVIGAILGIQGVARFKPMEDKFTVRAYIGPAFDLRFVLKASGIDDNEYHSEDPYTGTKTVGDARKDISSYFWGDGRFIFLAFGSGIDFPVLDTLQLGLDLRAWFPIWKLWTGEDLPAIEGWRFGVGFRISF